MIRRLFNIETLGNFLLNWEAKGKKRLVSHNFLAGWKKPKLLQVTRYFRFSQPCYWSSDLPLDKRAGMLAKSIAKSSILSPSLPLSLHWLYCPRRSLASSRTNFQASVPLAIFLQPLTPSFFKSFSASSNRLFVSFPAPSSQFLICHFCVPLLFRLNWLF